MIGKKARPGNAMNKSKPKPGGLINCPFCGRNFQPEDILFCDTVNTRIDVNAYDAVYAGFLQNIIPFTTVQTDGIIVEMEQRPKYYFHPWSDKNRQHKPPFHLPLDRQYSPDNALYPARIRVYRNNGLTPRTEMNGQQNNAADGDAEHTFDDPLVGDLFQSLRASSQEDDRPNFGDDVEITLTTKACPRCHCFLPENVGCYPIHRVVMLGSSRAGKTTYMTMAAHQATSGVGLPAGLMACNISPESKRYFDYLVTCLQKGILPATLLDVANSVRVAFPLLFTVQPPGGGEPFFLSIHDCPGEAMQNDGYLANFPALGTAEGAIMMLDPYQFLPSLDSQDINDGMDICTETFGQTVQLFGQNLPFFANLRILAFVLAKMDLVYGASEDKLIRPDDYPYMDCMDLQHQHAGGVDLDWISNLSIQVSGAICNQLRYPHFENQVNQLLERREGLEATAFCCSTQSWNDGSRSFVPIIDTVRRNGAVNMAGYRVLEPLLYILSKCGLIPVKSKTRSWWKR